MILNLSVETLRQFHHIIETTPSLCISGHNVRHFTYLFNMEDYRIIKVGSSYCKKHGLLKSSIKNELFIGVLREMIDLGENMGENNEKSNEKKGKNNKNNKNKNKKNLSNKIFECINKSIEQKISYFQNIELSNDSIKYYDYKLPLEHFKRDMIELGEVYFPENKEEYKYVIERIDDLLDILEISDIKIVVENEESEIRKTSTPEYTDSEDETKEIDNTLTNIQEEILRLLNYENMNKEENLIMESDIEGCVLDNIIDIKMTDREILENIEIEESIEFEKQEYEKQEYEKQEYEKQEFDELNEKYLEATIEDYYKDLEEKENTTELIKDIINEMTEDIEKYTESNLEKVEEKVEENSIQQNHSSKIKSLRTNCDSLFERINKLKHDISLYKIEFAVFQNDLQHFKNNIAKENAKKYAFFMKHNIPWTLPIPPAFP